jgi:Ni/Co efflux regulator RcnB
MRKLIFGFVTAGVVGTSMIALPPALASSHSDETAKSVASPSSTQKSQDEDEDKDKDKDKGKGKGKGDKDKDKDKHHGHHGHHCPYPTNDAHLSLSTASDESKVLLTGTLKKNKCDLDDEDVDVFDAKSGKLVGAAVTNAQGSFTVSVRATGNGSYVAKFAGHDDLSPATSNTVKVKADH